MHWSSPSPIRGNTSHSQRSKFLLQPPSIGRSIGEKEVEYEAPEHGDCSQEVEDELPSSDRVVGHSAKGQVRDVEITWTM